MYRIWDIKADKFCIIENWQFFLLDKEPLLFETEAEAEQHIAFAGARILKRDPSCGYNKDNYVVKEV